jgi:septum site-determining protein MinC
MTVSDGRVSLQEGVSVDAPGQEEFAAGDDGSAPGGAEVKGWRNGLLLMLPPPGGTWDEVIEQVHVRLDEAKARSFWRGAQTTIDCGARSVTLEELEALQHRIRGGFGLVPVAVISNDVVTRAAAEKLALTVYDELPVVRKPAPREREREVLSERSDAAGAVAAEPSTPAVAVPVAHGVAAAGATVAAPSGPTNNALYMPQTVRSGQRVVHDGHLVIFGDVNAGAEVMAGGDVLIFGALRGLAHAGCYGDEGARIVAASLRPPQLRIAGKIARSPETPGSGGGGRGNTKAAAPEVARIVEGEIQVFPL